MNLSEVQTWVGIAASTALVVSVCLLAYNLRESRRDARRTLAFSLLETLTSKEFADRRWRMRDSVQRAVAARWVGFDDSLEDFESRAFAYQYELIGQMVRARTLDYRQIRDFLKFSIIADWNAFDPLDAHLLERYPDHESPWSNFRALASEITRDLHGPPLVERPARRPPTGL